MQQQALDRSTTQLNPFTFTGGNGMSANYQNGQGGINFGALDSQQQNLLGLSGGALGAAQNPASQMGGFNQALNIGNWYAGGGLPQDPSQAGINMQANSLQGLFGNTLQGVQGFQGVGGGLASTAFRGAADQAVAASQGFSDVQANTLSQLRQQAQPFEQRQFDSLQNNQFATGRLGTSGGALQTEAFARGLGQADLSRQLASAQEARSTQQNALGLSQGLAGIGGGVQGLNDQLLQSAFGRFAQTSGMFGDVNQQRLGNSILMNDIGYQRNQQNFANQQTAALFPQQVQASWLQNALSALQGQAGIQNQGLNLFNTGLQAEQAAANARLGAGGTLGNIVNNPNFGAAGYGGAQALGQIAQQFAPQGGYVGALRDLFAPRQSTPLMQDVTGSLLGNVPAPRIGGL
jgi:hypothetical protein